MRRRDREIKEFDEIVKIIKKVRQSGFRIKR